jgi:hypothetical protein
MFIQSKGMSDRLLHSTQPQPACSTRPMEQLTLRGFLLRLAAAMALVAITYNPSGHSFVHWLRATLPTVSPVQALLGLVLIGGWGLFGHATWRSLGTAGLVLGAAIATVLIWLLVSWGWLSLKNDAALSWAILLAIAVLLAVGVSWSHVRRRLTGQTDVEEVERR